MNKGIILNKFKLETVIIGENGITIDDILVHDAYEQDSDKVDATLMPEGRRIRHLMLMPEMSSSW